MQWPCPVCAYNGHSKVQLDKCKTNDLPCVPPSTDIGGRNGVLSKYQSLATVVVVVVVVEIIKLYQVQTGRFLATTGYVAPLPQLCSLHCSHPLQILLLKDILDPPATLEVGVYQQPFSVLIMCTIDNPICPAIESTKCPVVYLGLSGGPMLTIGESCASSSNTVLLIPFLEQLVHWTFDCPACTVWSACPFKGAVHSNSESSSS